MAYIMKAFVLSSMVAGVVYSVQHGARVAEETFTNLVQRSYSPEHFTSDPSNAAIKQDVEAINQSYLQARNR